ncbi:MAG: sortase [Clostridia bacterium]|nr:sortase [Clostridia bacterium]
MFEGKYGKVLNILLVVVIVGIIGLLSYLGYDFYKKYYMEKETKKAIDEFNDYVSNEEEQNQTEGEEVAPIMDGNLITSTTSGNKTSITYKGFNVVGKIEIPAIKLEYPVLEKTTVKSIEVAVAVLCGPGINQIGNTVIVGHNYRNGTFFSNNKKLEVGDKIFLTDNSGSRLSYSIYNKYTTTDDDSDYISRDTNGKREISLSTCTDDAKTRLIIWAKED